MKTVRLLLPLLLLSSGCLYDPSPNGSCNWGGALRLVDTVWKCDTEHTAVVIPPPTTTYYVDGTHPSASDANAGTDENAPWETIVHAAATVTAGEAVQVKAGTYDDGTIVLANSGTPGAPIVIEAFPGDELQATILGNGFHSTGKSHVVLRGLNFESINGNGIRFEGPPNPADPPATDIVILGNRTHDTCSSGVSIWGVDWGVDPGNYDNIRDVIIESNIIELGTNGCFNEIVTVANGAVNVDVRFNTIRYGSAIAGGDEGIDFKEGVRDSRIYGNTIYDLSDKAIYIDGGSGDEDPQISNIHIFNNHLHDLPSTGMTITTEGKGDVSLVFVYNNIIYNTDRDGILVYDHPGGNADGGTVTNVWIYNNTVTQGGLEGPGWGGIRVNHETAAVVIVNNIAWNNPGYDIRGDLVTTISSANLCGEPECAVNGDPLLKPNWAPMAGSPAIDAGAPVYLAKDFRGTKRPQGSAFDLGAIEVAQPGS